MENCFHFHNKIEKLINKIEKLICRGYLGEFVDKKQDKQPEEKHNHQHQALHRIERVVVKAKNIRTKIYQQLGLSPLSPAVPWERIPRICKRLSYSERPMKWKLLLEARSCMFVSSPWRYLLGRRTWKNPKNLNNDALVISAMLSNLWVKKILVDCGSSADIIFYDAFKQLRIDNAQLTEVRTLLVDFSGKVVAALE